MVRKKCTKPKCKKNSCGPTGLDGILKFLKSGKFFVYFLLFFLAFISIRLFKIPYTKSDWGVCRLSFTLGALLQFIVLYIFVFITLLFLKLIIKILKLLIKWIKGIFKKRPNKTSMQKFVNVCIIIGLLILISIVGRFLFFILVIYGYGLYYSFGLVMGYTVIGSNNECIELPQKKK
uniref:Uncharacterized protein n=1 Tax=viral metagenome TaxID=1070528 RepID=A0A6C0JM78_9ZZZZ